MRTEHLTVVLQAVGIPDANAEVARMATAKLQARPLRKCELNAWNRWHRDSSVATLIALTQRGIFPVIRGGKA